MELRPPCLDHVAIRVTDIRRAVDWYLDKYDASEVFSDDTWGMIEINGIKIAFILEDSHPPHIAFTQFSKVPAEAKRHRDGSWYIYDRDPDGNVIERIWWPSDFPEPEKT